MAGARNYARIAGEYARRAVADEKGLAHCKWVRLACRRFLDDLEWAAGGRWAYAFDKRLAGDVCGFIEKLPHVEGSWDTSALRLEPWQIFILANIFGWRRRSDGGRRFDTAYIEVARKNGKSTWTAGVALYCLACDGEIGPQIKCAATTGSQARIVFNPAKKMVERTPDLAEAFHIEPMANAIVCHDTGGSIQPINAKAQTQDGLNPSLAILDELHAHPTRHLFDVLKSARGARKSPLTWCITTAGYDVEGVCYEQRTMLTRILAGLVPGEHCFGIIYTLDDGDDPLDEAVWIKSNPNLGVSVGLEEFRNYASEARLSAASMFEFRTKRLNVWTSAYGAWINMEEWKRCDGPVDLELLAGEPCWAGLDLASSRDITAFVVVWRVGGRWKVWGRYYLPEDVVAPRTQRSQAPYQAWADRGLLTVTPGNVTDNAFVERDIMAVLDRFNVRAIAYDSWGARDLVSRLIEQGAPMIEFRQGGQSYGPPMKEFDDVLNAGTLDHGGNPVLAWMASNLVARFDVNMNAAPHRKNSKDKIDGVVAMLMAMGVALTAPGPSVYESRGVVVI